MNIPSLRQWRVRRLMLTGVLAVSAFAMVATACGDDDDDEPEVTSTPTEASETATGEATEGNGDGTVLELSAEDEFSFNTDELTAPADTPFTIEFDNQDDLVHNVAILDEDGEVLAATELETGPVMQELEVEGLAAGEYTFECEAHPVDMVGTLTVE